MYTCVCCCLCLCIPVTLLYLFSGYDMLFKTDHTDQKKRLFAVKREVKALEKQHIATNEHT